MSTCFAQIADCRAMQMLAQAMLVHTRAEVAGLDLPVVATATPYRAGGRAGALNYTDIRAGDLSVRHLFDLCPFPDTLVAIRTTGADLIEQMERAAALFAQITPGGRDQPLVDPAFPGFAFAAFHGISYQIDASAPARYDAHGLLLRPEARRILAPQIAGRAVRPDDQLLLATNNYRIGGTLGICPPVQGDVVLDQRVLCTDVLAAFIRSRRRADPEAPSEGWSLRALPDTSVTYDTGPNALDHLADVAHLRPEFIGLTEAGFHRFRLNL